MAPDAPLWRLTARQIVYAVIPHLQNGPEVMMENFIQVYTTTEDGDEAGRIARSLVEKRLAACVQILGPVSSTYWWEDNVVEEHEYICVIKSRQDLYRDIEQSIREVHSYETPEILAVRLSEGSSAYFDWMEKELKKNEG
jgi:periplasmic divalent cation tolerance protein